MTRRLAAAWGALALVLASSGVAAGADRWPLFGGDASRSGYDAADPGEVPVGAVWSRLGPDANVRTPVVVSGGGGPDAQRVAYGTANGRVHLQELGSGATVGPEEGIEIDTGFLDNTDNFGTEDGADAVGFADTSTAERLGQLLVLHGDEAGAVVEIARIDLANAEKNHEEPVDNLAGCRPQSSPMLTPPDATGGRVLYFTVDCSVDPLLVRVPIVGDATRREAVVGEATYSVVPGLNPVASPALVVLPDAGGTPRFYVAVARSGSVNFYDASLALGATDAQEVPPSLVAPLGSGNEVAQTPAAPATPAGAVAGGEGSGTGPAPAVYVAAAVDAQTKVYKFVRQGPGLIAAASRLLPNSGAPAPAMAVAETVTASGAAAGGRLVVTSASNLTVLDTADLGRVRQLSPSGPLGADRGFARTTAAVSGAYAYVARDGGSSPPEHLVVRVEDATAIGAPDFVQAPGNGAGPAWGQPAIARGYAIFGGPSGAFAYRSRDITAPRVDLVAPAPGPVRGNVELAALAADARGIAGVTFRLTVDRGAGRTVGRAETAASGSPYATEPGGGGRFVVSFASGGVPNGEYVLEAVAVDPAGNATTSAKRRLTVENPPGANNARPGACVNKVLGTRRADRLRGGRGGDRIVGRAGNDRISAGGGHDCVLGQSGRDRVTGGTGGDVLAGGPGDDRLTGGRGRDRLSGGRGTDVLLTADRRRDTIRCGRGRDRVVADRSDRVRGDCERVRRRR